MRVLLAGATGALGHAAIPRLVAAGHDVVATTRHAHAQDELARLGSVPAIADVLDPDSLHRLLSEHPVDAVVHAAKAIPKRGPLTYRDMRATDRLHHAGTRNLLAAATSAGVRRFVAESVVLVYGYGDRGPAPITEDASTDVDVPRGCRPIHAAAVSMERQALAAGDLMESVVLRCGLFYGPRATDRLAALLRRRAAPLPRGAAGLWPLLHVDDAADAVVASLTAPPGVYNVVDHEPVEPRRFLETIAAVEGAPPPLSLPRSVMAGVAPYFTTVATTRLPVMTTRAHALGWRPRYPSYREGIAAWLAPSTEAGSR